MSAQQSSQSDGMSSAHPKSQLTTRSHRGQKNVLCFVQSVNGELFESWQGFRFLALHFPLIIMA